MYLAVLLNGHYQRNKVLNISFRNICYETYNVEKFRVDLKKSMGTLSNNIGTLLTNHINLGIKPIEDKVFQLHTKLLFVCLYFPKEEFIF